MRTIVHRRTPLQESRSEHRGSHLKLRPRTTLFLSRARLLIESASRRPGGLGTLSVGLSHRSALSLLLAPPRFLSLYPRCFFLYCTDCGPPLMGIRGYSRISPRASSLFNTSPDFPSFQQMARKRADREREAAQLPRELGSSWWSSYANTNVTYKQTSATLNQILNPD